MQRRGAEETSSTRGRRAASFPGGCGGGASTLKPTPFEGTLASHCHAMPRPAPPRSSPTSPRRETPKAPLGPCWSAGLASGVWMATLKSCTRPRPADRPSRRRANRPDTVAKAPKSRFARGSSRVKLRSSSSTQAAPSSKSPQHRKISQAEQVPIVKPCRVAGRILRYRLRMRPISQPPSADLLGKQNSRQVKMREGGFVNSAFASSSSAQRGRTSMRCSASQKPIF